MFVEHFKEERTRTGQGGGSRKEKVVKKIK